MFDKFRAKASEMTLKAGLKIRKHSPEILFGAGVVLFIGTIAMTVKAAPKVNDILEEHNEKREILTKKKEESPEYVGYSKDLAGLYKNTAIKTFRGFFIALLRFQIRSSFSRRFGLLYSFRKNLSSMRNLSVGVEWLQEKTTPQNGLVFRKV